MLIKIKSSIRSTFIFLMFIYGGNFLFAGNSLFSQDKNVPDFRSYFSIDTIITNIVNSEKIFATQENNITIPDQLGKAQINFQINTFINYLHFNHFVRNESKKMFFQAWLKEKELQRLSVKTDSLRIVYKNASSMQKEEISSFILAAEEKSKILNEEIAATYQKAREEEDLYWQSASLDEIAKFQEKIRIYKDSLTQVVKVQSGQSPNIYSEIRDTITLFNLPAKQVEKKVTVDEGVIYKIQIGAYKGKIPESANRLIKKLTLIRKIDNYIDDKGVTIYTTGSLRLYQEAVTMQNQVKQEGIKNPIITAYRNGKKITINEARKLNNEL